ERAKEKSSMVDLIEEQMVSLTFLDGDRLRPSFALDSDYYQRLCALWTNTLILKLLGRTIGYKALHTRLMQLWKLGASVKILDLGHGCYLAKFTSLVDLEKCDHLGKTMAWISLPGLPLMYYDDDLLTTFASAIGKPIKIDSNTSEATRALYAQMCVEIDFGLPLVPVVHIQDEAFKVQYEGLHTICLNCGRYGHTIIQCQFDQPDVPIEPAEGVSPENYMELIVWNFRGAGGREFARCFRDLCSQHHPEVVFLFEVRIFGERAGRVSMQFGFDSAVRMDPVGFSGGIWVLWKSNVVQLRQWGSHLQCLTFRFDLARGGYWFGLASSSLLQLERELQQEYKLVLHYGENKALFLLRIIRRDFIASSIPQIPHYLELFMVALGTLEQLKHVPFELMTNEGLSYLASAIGKSLHMNQDCSKLFSSDRVTVCID
ncbi:hypothetical protein Tsubulata_016465, partial [Turnera subulata]